MRLLLLIVRETTTHFLYHKLNCTMRIGEICRYLYTAYKIMETCITFIGSCRPMLVMHYSLFISL